MNCNVSLIFLLQRHLWNVHCTQVNSYDVEFGTSSPRILEKFTRCKVCLEILKPESVFKHAWDEHNMGMAKYFNFELDLVICFYFIPVSFLFNVISISLLFTLFFKLCTK